MILHFDSVTESPILHFSAVTVVKSVDLVKFGSFHGSGERSLPSSAIEEGYQVLHQLSLP